MAPLFSLSSPRVEAGGGSGATPIYTHGPSEGHRAHPTGTPGVVKRLHRGTTRGEPSYPLSCTRGHTRGIPKGSARGAEGEGRAIGFFDRAGRAGRATRSRAATGQNGAESQKAKNPKLHHTNELADSDRLGLGARGCAILTPLYVEGQHPNQQTRTQGGNRRPGDTGSSGRGTGAQPLPRPSRVRGRNPALAQ